MLMDERTVSQAEHTGLFLKAANGTTFIGTPTTGANGDVTDFSLPGGIKVGLTGQSVAHPDGTQLQRVGLTPDIHVTATIKGVRDGVDEVLERALEFMTLFQVEKATAYTP
jgi:C-terminal processing protease CtpA/Prc